jgi:hypothetical protein
LLVNIQFACQKHYFGAMAEQYFDNQSKELVANTQRCQKTVEAFNRLPEEFTSEDVMRCFGLDKPSTSRTRICRLMSDHLVEKIGEYKENGKMRKKYRKTGYMV